ncbi:hypothetical protein BgiMline_002401 [Biomphalaria glabrata]|nr:hypothetical protein BgiMline_002277 [Biomphalaria glabrata]
MTTSYLTDDSTMTAGWDRQQDHEYRQSVVEQAKCLSVNHLGQSLSDLDLSTCICSATIHQLKREKKLFMCEGSKLDTRLTLLIGALENQSDDTRSFNPGHVSGTLISGLTVNS